MIPFLEAVEIILGQAAVRPPVLMPQKEKRERGELRVYTFMDDEMLSAFDGNKTVTAMRAV